MKTQQSKSLFFFCLLSSVFCIPANAQIVYTDVNPDQTFTNGSYNLDLNNDGINDFDLVITSAIIGLSCRGGCGAGAAENKTLSIQPLENNEVGNDGNRLNQNILIDSSFIPWSNNTKTMAKISWKSECVAFSFCGSAHLSGDWSKGDTDKYLALRIKVDSRFYYGWARLNVVNNVVSFTIKDYAYNSIPDQSILAGDSGSIATNIHHIKSFSSLVISPNSFQHLTRISFSLPQPEKITLIIYDLTGRVIKILADEMMSAGTGILTWDARDENGEAVSPGIYFLKIQSADFSQTEKLMVVK